MNRLPALLVGLGLAILVVMGIEIVRVLTSGGAELAVALVNLLGTLPFVGLLIGGGYWLGSSEISRGRYPRICGWVTGGAVFLVGFFGLIALLTQDDVAAIVGMVRWAFATGAGIGLLIGVFEARAVGRGIEAERARVRNEALTRKNDRLEEVASIISHDLRSPLDVARGYLELLREGSDDGHASRIEAAHDRMETIIDDVLLLARSGRQIGEREPVSLDELARTAWATVETDGATLVVETSHPIKVDRDRVRHLFENCFRNAVEHSSTSPPSNARENAVELGGTAVTVTVGTLDGGFFVADDGPGIPDKELENVMENGYSTRTDGTGFGLAIVRRVAHAHGWSIDVGNGPDGGARFEFRDVTTSRDAAAVAHREAG